jgi:hypothetical protein
MKPAHFARELAEDREKLEQSRHVKRFRESYRVSHTGCWLWTKQQTKLGFGRFNAGLHSMLAHELAFTLATGEVPQNEIIKQTCGNRLCVNPAHLVRSGRPRFFECGIQITEKQQRARAARRGEQHG